MELLRSVIVGTAGTLYHDGLFTFDCLFPSDYPNSPPGERHSKQHNEEVFVLSLKTMVYTVRGPPKHFEDFVVHHFRRRAPDILVACNAYLEGALVGSEINKDGGVVNQAESKCSSSKSKFKSDVAGLMKVLVRNFVENGSPETELESFRIAAQKYIYK
ncbi:Ubiquitin-fold modifier-conjugating enzyme [Trema orientale]|uniref:Ubiquitin-fold modifier-conjugating enzyme n=1 Tax=Trema orientale TaxID=63057 RepID=A0A2P5EG00_TREOI|nr:Ubiquitin-fold modifier-conjugating enzyme [Trema orientale]